MNTNDMAVEEFFSNYTKTLIDKLGDAGRREKIGIPVITISMQPGGGGDAIARKLAERLGFSLFNKEILKPMADWNNVSSKVLEAVEKYRMTGIQDMISSLMGKQHVYPEQYLRYLTEFVTVLGRVGNAVVVGRGVNFILPASSRFAVRIIAPLDTRVKNVASAFGVPLEKAKRRIKNRAAKRRDFVKRNFHVDIDDPLHYDLIINTQRLDVESAVDAIIGTIMGAQFNHPFEKEESFILGKSR